MLNLLVDFILLSGVIYLFIKYSVIPQIEKTHRKKTLLMAADSGRTSQRRRNNRGRYATTSSAECSDAALSDY